MIKLLIYILISLISYPTYSYVGPGMGGGVIAALIGFLAAIIIGIWGIIYYPIKRALKRKKDSNQNTE